MKFGFCYVIGFVYIGLGNDVVEEKVDRGGFTIVLKVEIVAMTNKH